MSKEQKKAIRTAILKIRDSLTPAEIHKAEKQILQNLSGISQLQQAKNVFCYVSFRSEVPTGSIIEHFRQQGKNMFLPVCIQETKELILAQLDDESRLVSTHYGLLEPSRDSIRIADRSLLDAALMPGSAFDARGYRIGYGAGYYDKFFSHTKKDVFKIALAYSFQMIDEVPRDKYDVPVDCIVTEKEIILCQK